MFTTISDRQLIERQRRIQNKGTKALFRRSITGGNIGATAFFAATIA